MSSQEDINPDGLPDTSGINKDVLFDPKPKPKIIRVLTVMAYVLSVSMAAIMLSIYYIFMWDGRPHIGALRNGGYEYGHDISIVHQPTEYLQLVENITEDQKLSPEPFQLTTRHSSYILEILNIDNTTEPEETFSFPSSTETVENNSTHDSDNTEMQQQFTDGDSEALKILPTVPTLVEHSSTENTTWSRDYETLEDFSGASPFLKKLIDSRYDEDY